MFGRGKALLVLALLVAIPTAAVAQTADTSAAPPAQSQPAQPQIGQPPPGQPLLKPEQLDALAAPIALISAVSDVLTCGAAPRVIMDLRNRTLVDL